MEAAVRQRVFARSLRRPVVAAEDLASQVERLMARRLAEAVSLARKAGLLVVGFQVDDLIARGRAVLLIHAADAGKDGAAKLSRKFEALLGCGQDQLAIVTDLTGQQLDLAIGRSNVVHAAASGGGASRRCAGGRPPPAVSVWKFLQERSRTRDVHERD